MTTFAEVTVWLNHTAATAFATSISRAEILGFGTGLWCVWLTRSNNIWNFPVGIANCLLLLFLFWQGRLFADASLQVVFILLGLAGWWKWARGQQGSSLPVTRLSGKGIAVAVLTALAFWVLLLPALMAARGSVPLFDAGITSLSLVAQWLLNQRRLETWFFWISVDVISIPVYLYKDLYLIAILYFVFLMICLDGYRRWKGQVVW